MLSVTASSGHRFPHRHIDAHPGMNELHQVVRADFLKVWAEWGILCCSGEIDIAPKEVWDGAKSWQARE